MKYMHLQTSYDFSLFDNGVLVMAFRSLAANLQAAEFLGESVSKVTMEKYNAVVSEMRDRGLFMEMAEGRLK